MTENETAFSTRAFPQVGVSAAGKSAGSGSESQAVFRDTDLGRFILKKYPKRKFVNFVMGAALTLAALLALYPLLSVFYFVLIRGLPGLKLAFFTAMPKPVGELGGGMANSLIGTLIMIGIASAIGVPCGILTGLYLSEYSRERAAYLVRFCADVLASVPSIVIGLFVYAAIVMPMKRFSALAGGLALGILMIPTVARSSEELFKRVPYHLREAGLALGLSRWKVSLFIVLRGCLGGISTGVILAVARVAGETAPLLFTALNNRFWSLSLDQPMSSLPVQIYTYAISPFEDWQQQAWTGALVLVALVLVLNLTTRFLLAPVAAGGRRRG